MSVITLETMKQTVTDIRRNKSYMNKKSLVKCLAFSHLIEMINRGLISKDYKFDTEIGNVYCSILSRTGDHVHYASLVKHDDINEDLITWIAKRIHYYNESVSKYNTGIYKYLSIQKTNTDRISKKNMALSMLFELEKDEVKIYDTITNNVGSLCLGKTHTLLMELHRIYEDMRFLKMCATGEKSKTTSSFYTIRTLEILEMINSKELSVPENKFRLYRKSDYTGVETEKFLYIDIKHIIEMKEKFSLKDAYKLLQYWYNAKTMYNEYMAKTSTVQDINKIFKK